MGDLVSALGESRRSYRGGVSRPWAHGRHRSRVLTNSSWTTSPRCWHISESSRPTSTATASEAVWRCSSACGTHKRPQAGHRVRVLQQRRHVPRGLWRHTEHHSRVVRWHAVARGLRADCARSVGVPDSGRRFPQLDMTPFDWPIGELAAPALILIGDCDGTRLEHAVDPFRRLGGRSVRRSRSRAACLTDGDPARHDARRHAGAHELDRVDGHDLPRHLGGDRPLLRVPIARSGARGRDV